MTDMLEKIIDPVPVADFRRAHWEKAPLHVTRPMPEWCRELPVVHDLDSLVALAALEDWNSLRIVQSQAGLPAEMPLRGKDGPRGIEAVYRAYAQGWSVLVNGLHRRSPEVGRLATMEDRQDIYRTLAFEGTSVYGETTNTNELFGLKP